MELNESGLILAVATCFLQCPTRQSANMEWFKPQACFGALGIGGTATIQSPTEGAVLRNGMTGIAE